MDSADSKRFEESRKALEDVLSEANLHEKPVLVFANKQVRYENMYPLLFSQIL